jgi:RNA polymerase sigma-70 factor (ECF subfamily)
MVAELTEVRHWTKVEGTACLQDKAGPLADAVDRRDWDVFYAYCDGVIRNTLAARGLQEADREDCRQEVWVAILGRRTSCPGGGDFSSWIAAIARNKAIDTIRRGRRHPVGVSFDVEQERGGNSVSRCGADEARGLVWSALAELERQVEPRSFLVFFLHSMEGLPFREIAAALSLNEVQARLRHHRAKQKFRELLARAAGPTPEKTAPRDTKPRPRR